MSAAMEGGRYAGYVLAAYGLSAAVLLAVTVWRIASARLWRRRAEARRPRR